MEKIDSSKSTTSTTTTYVYSRDNILSEYKTVASGSLTLKKNYINGIGTDNVIAYDVDESTNQGQISFCQNRVLPYSSEFTTYGYTSIVNDCNNAQNSSTGIVTNRYYYHMNQLGSAIALTNSTGAVMQIYSYDAFGKVYVSNSGTLTSLDSYTGNTYSNSRLYTGREYDRESGLYYLRARYYDAERFGRFLSRDPIGQNDQVNLYTYVANSPLMYTDRNGREKKFIREHDATTLLKKDMEGVRKDHFFGKVAKSGFMDNSYNPKMRSDYRELSFDPNTKESCAGKKYSANCVVYFEGQEYKLDQLGNMLIGYGYTYSYMPKVLIYSAGFSVEVYKRNFNPIKANQNEIEDRPYYDKGIDRAVNEIKSTIEASLKLLEILKRNYHLM